jgi:hypothetical protein
MPARSTKFIKRCAEWIPKDDSRFIPKRTRGLYALLQYRPKTQKYDVSYIGMTARSSIRNRLARHKRDQAKSWSHFSAFEVWHDVSEDDIKELEGLFREVYRKNTKFNQLGKYGRLQKVRNDDLRSWKKKG